MRGTGWPGCWSADRGASLTEAAIVVCLLTLIAAIAIPPVNIEARRGFCAFHVGLSGGTPADVYNGQYFLPNGPGGTYKCNTTRYGSGPGSSFFW